MAKQAGSYLKRATREWAKPPRQKLSILGKWGIAEGHRSGIAMIAGAAICAALGGITVFAVDAAVAGKQEEKTGSGQTVPHSPKAADSVTKTQKVSEKQLLGLEFSALAKASIPMSVYWKEEDVVVDDEFQATGSTCVMGVSKEGYIILATNRHCLGLLELAVADGETDLPEILDYSIHLHFPRNRVVRATHFGWFEGDADLAYLAVPVRGLEAGKDFVSLVPDPVGDFFSIGSEVVAVGAPYGLDGTHTFGRISALRDNKDSEGKGFQLIQTDAPLNPGNSGGPLLWKKDDRYFWIGINTSGAGQNLGFAIARKELGRRKGIYYEASAAGARKLIYGQ